MPPKKAAATEQAEQAKLPTVGRIVHYHPDKAAPPMAAMVTGSDKRTLALFIIPQNRTPFHLEGILHQQEASEEAGYWIYPPIV